MQATMTESAGTHLEPIPDPEWVTGIDHRENAIGEIIAVAVDIDRQIGAITDAIARRLGQDDDGHMPTEAVVRKPLCVVDAATSLPAQGAQLAARLYPHAARLVDQALYWDPEWRLDKWPLGRQREAIRQLFVDAGIGERFMPDAKLQAGRSAEDER